MQKQKAARMAASFNFVTDSIIAVWMKLTCSDFSLCFVGVRCFGGLTSDFWSVFAKSFCKSKEIQGLSAPALKRLRSR
jgi:hypothetical protein